MVEVVWVSELLGLRVPVIVEGLKFDDAEDRHRGGIPDVQAIDSCLHPRVGCRLVLCGPRIRHELRRVVATDYDCGTEDIDDWHRLSNLDGYTV